MLIQETILAMGPAPGGGQGGSPLPTVLMFAGIFAVMYFMMIRPQQKRQKEQQNMMNSLTKGDKVVTGTGIHGKIVELDEKTVVLDIANNVHVKFEKAAITQKVS